MTILEKYFGLCTICNVIMSVTILMINSLNVLDKDFNNFLFFFALVNMFKIGNQFKILKNLSVQVINVVNIIVDTILDFAKIIIYTIIMGACTYIKTI